MVQAGDRAVKNASSPGGAGGGRGRSSVLLNQAAPDGEGKGEERTRDKRPKEITSPLVSPGGSTGSTNTTSNPPRPSQHRRLPKLQQAQSHDPDPTRLPMIAPRINRATSSTSSSTTPVPAVPMEGVNSPSTSNSTTPVAAKPPGPLPRIPVFPLVDSYVPDPTSTDRRHPRQLVPKDLGFPTAEMNGRIRKEDLDDRLLMATCAVMHRHQNRALCPKEVAEVMLEQGWLKNAGTTPFAHVSTCIRAHIARSSSAAPPYPPLLIPFELVGALTVEEVRAVGLHAEQRPAVKRGTLWYLNPQVFGPGVGADDPFVRCRREVGMAGSDKDGLYVRGLVPLQASHPSVPSPGLRLSSTLYISNGADDDGDEEGMGRGKRKRRASSAMMAAMSTSEPNSGLPNPSLSASPAISTLPPPPVAIPSPKPPASMTMTPTNPPTARRNAAFGPSSAPVRSSLPKLKLRLTSLEEVESDVVDSDGHTGEAAVRRRKSKKKTKRAGSEGVSRAGSVEPMAMSTELPGTPRSRSSTFSATSSSALLAQSLLAASSSSSTPTVSSTAPVTTNPVVSPDVLSLTNATINQALHRPTSLPATPALHLSMSAPNIFQNHFSSAPSPPDLMDQDSSSDTAKNSSMANPLDSVASPPRSDSADEEDFHEAMLRGDDFDFEWGADSYTTGSSSVVSVNNGELPFQHSPQPPELSLPLLPSKQRNKLPTQGDEPITLDDTTIDTPATTPRNPDEMDQEDKEEKDAGVKKEEEDEKIEEGPLGKISRVGMQATLCGAMQAREQEEDDDDEVVIVEKDIRTKQEETPSAPLDSFIHESPTRLRKPSIPHLSSDVSGIPVPLPSPLSLDLPSMTNSFHGNEFDFVGVEEDEFDFDQSPILRSSSIDHAESADDEDESDQEENDIVTVKLEDDEAHFTNLSHPSSRASSTYPLDSFDRDLLLRATSTGASSNSSEGSAFDPHLVVSSSLLATGLPVPQQAPSPPETTDWSMNVDFEELDGELGTHVDLLAPESIGLEELDLAWAGGEDEEQELENDQILLASPKNGNVRSTFLTPAPGTSSKSNAFLTGSSTPRFTTSLPAPLTRRPSLMGDLTGKGKATVAQIPSAGEETEAPSRRTSGRKTNKTLKAQHVAEAEAEDDDDDQGQEEEEVEEEEEEEEVRKPRRRTKSSQSTVTATAASPRKSSRRTSAAAAAK